MTEISPTASDPLVHLPGPVAERTRCVLEHAPRPGAGGHEQREPAAAAGGGEATATAPLEPFVTQVARTVCLVALTLPPDVPLGDVDARTLEWLIHGTQYHPGESGDPRTHRWLRFESELRRGGDQANAVVAHACAIIFSLPVRDLQEHPLGDGVDRVELAVGAAGAYGLARSPGSTWTGIALAVRVYLDLE